MALTQTQKDFFWEHGYLSYGALLKPEEVERYRREYDAELARAEEAGNFRNLSLSDGKSLEERKGAPKKVYQLMQMCERNIAFRELIYDARILDILEDLIGPNLLLFHDQALYKPPHTGGAVFWHQDNAYWKCTPANLVSCWLTLDETVKESGAMQVIPGSHLKPIWHEKSAETNALLDFKGIDEARAVPVPLPAGGVMFHHCQTLHYTAPNTTERHRRAYAIHYMPAGTKGREGEVMRVGFKHPALRMCV